MDTPVLKTIVSYDDPHYIVVADAESVTRLFYCAQPSHGGSPYWNISHTRVHPFQIDAQTGALLTFPFPPARR